MNKSFKYIGITITSIGAVLAGLFFLGKRRKEKKRLEFKENDLNNNPEIEIEDIS